jgi:4'-phosphopantetheinyl transferase EntD
MQARSNGRLSVALATIQELPDLAVTGIDAERQASRIAADRAIRGIIGAAGTIEVQRRAGRAPVAHVRDDIGRRQRVSLSLTHRDGRAAAVAAPSASRIGIDLENVEAIDPARERFFLTDRERRVLSHASASELWSMKEAVWKALELSSTVGFHELELDIDANGDVGSARCRGSRFHVHMQLTSPWPGYVLAVAQLGVLS